MSSGVDIILDDGTISYGNPVIYADSIAHLPHLNAFDLLVKKRFDELQLDALLVYLIDTVEESALTYLAAQFDVLGFKGYGLATNTAEKREVIKRAIELHRYKGTIWSIKEALGTLGYTNVIFTEHVAGHWAKFKVTVDIGGNPISVAAIADLVRMIDEYKNTRSLLNEIQVAVTIDSEEITLTDESIENQAANDEDAINVGGNFKYDGTYTYDGAKNYSQDQDVLTITIV